MLFLFASFLLSLNHHSFLPIEIWLKCLKLLLAVLVGIMDVTESKLLTGLVDFRHETNVGHWLFKELLCQMQTIKYDLVSE